MELPKKQEVVKLHPGLTFLIKYLPDLFITVIPARQLRSCKT